MEMLHTVDVGRRRVDQFKLALKRMDYSFTSQLSKSTYCSLNT